MKLNFLLPFLCVSLLLTGCVEKITRNIEHNTVPLEFATGREELNSKIFEVIPFEEIEISTAHIEISGEGANNFIVVEISGPREFPTGGMEFSNLANQIAKIVKEDLKNIGDFQKLKIELRNTVKENNTEHTRTFKKEIEL